MSSRFAFTPEDWERIHRDWSAWWEHALDRPLIVLSGYQPGRIPPQPPLYTAQLPETMPVEQILDLYQADLEARCWYGDAMPRWKMTFGAVVLAAFLGAKVNVSSETVWFEPAQPTPIQELRPALNEANPLWRRVTALTGQAAARWQNEVCVSYVDLGGSLDVLASLRSTQNLLYDLYDDPQQVRRLTTSVTSAWLRCFRALDSIIGKSCVGKTSWAPVWASASTYMLQCDFAYMISPHMFVEYVLPDLETCCQEVVYPFYHMDGKGQLPHLDALLALPHLRGIQWIPGEGQPPPEQWLDLLNRIRAASKLCQLFVSPQGARTIVRELGGTGFILAITEEMTPEAAAAFLEEIDQEQKQSLRLT